MHPIAIKNGTVTTTAYAYRNSANTGVAIISEDTIASTGKNTKIFCFFKILIQNIANAINV